VTLHFSLHPVGLVGSMPVNAAVGAFRVVEQDCSIYCSCYLPEAGKRLSVKQFVLDGVVDTLSHRIVLRVTAFGHAGSDMTACEQADVIGTGILTATVGVVDERCVKVVRKRTYGHLQRLDAVSSLKRRSDIPAHNALAIGIHDDCQETEAIAQTGYRVLYRNIGDVADPNLVGAGWYHILHEVRIRRQVVAGVRCARCTLTVTDVQPTLVQDAAEHVATDAVLVIEAAFIYTPQIVGSHLRVLSPDFAHELHHKLLYRQTAEQQVVITFVEGLSCHTGQCTEIGDGIMPHLVFVKPFDCPVPAFFRISILNISSATSIIVS